MFSRNYTVKPLQLLALRYLFWRLFRDAASFGFCTQEVSNSSFHNKFCKIPQALRGGPEISQSVKGGRQLRPRLGPAPVQAQEPRVGVLALARVLFRRLAQLLGRAGLVQKVID